MRSGGCLPIPVKRHIILQPQRSSCINYWHSGWQKAGLQLSCFALWYIQRPLLQNLQYLICHICNMLPN